MSHSVRNCQIAVYGATALVDALTTGRATSINASDNRIGDFGAQRVAIALASNCVVQTMRLSDNLIGSDGAAVLLEALQENHSVEVLSLSRNAIGPGGLEHVAHALHVNASLTELDLSNNCLGDRGASLLASGLKVNSSLRDLDLRVNSIGDKGAVQLASALGANTSLERLSLTDNAIGDEGAMALAESLLKNVGMSLLDIGFNSSISIAGVEHLVAAAKASSSLAALGLQGLRAAEPFLGSLREALEQNRSVYIATVWADEIPGGLLQISCTSMAGESSVSCVLESRASLSALQVEVARQVGVRKGLLRLLRPDGTFLTDTSIPLARLLGFNCEEGHHEHEHVPISIFDMEST